MAEAGALRALLHVRRLGRVEYEAASALQAELVGRRRREEIPDQLLLLEHPHVITLGSGAKSEHVLADEAARRRLGVALAETGRGGDVTYHGPGQLVGYPILALETDRRDLHRYLRELEEVLLRVLSGFGIEGSRIEGNTGVWTDRGKIAAIGIRVSSGWITSHGFALNVSPRLEYFDTIVPCGLNDRRVTSLEDLLQRPIAMDEVLDCVAREFVAVFERDAREMDGRP